MIPATGTLPKTSVNYKLIPASPGSKYSPLIYGVSETGPRLGSVNAGNSYSYYVGGAGINAAFASFLPQSIAYQNLHTLLYNASSPGLSVESNFPTGSPLQFMLLNKAQPGTHGFSSGEGSVFVDIFSSAGQPHSNADNYAMVYVCPPDGRQGYTTKTQFLTAVELTATNAIEAVQAYNTQYATGAGAGLQTVQTVRFCLYSSNIYLFAGATVQEVALAIYTGLLTPLQKSAGSIDTIELENANGEWDNAIGTV
jgi:hypothetical protein